MTLRERIVKTRLKISLASLSSRQEKLWQLLSNKSTKWEEDKHPRADDGRFGSKPASGDGEAKERTTEESSARPDSTDQPGQSSSPLASFHEAVTSLREQVEAGELGYALRANPGGH